MSSPFADELFWLSARQVLEGLRDGAVVVAPDGAIRAVNRAFCSVTGYTRREAIGKNPRMLQSGRHNRSFYAKLWSSLLRKGVWQGEIWNRRKNGNVYPEWLTISVIRDENGETLCYLGVFSDITIRKTSEEKLNRLAEHDALTGLPNRRFFVEKLRRMKKTADPRHPTAVLFLDLDRFKEINDRWGHAAGDQFLSAVGERLNGCVRRTDTVARWGGDEFIIFLDPISGRRNAARVARKILRVLRQPFTSRDRRIRATASIGVCLIDEKTSSSEAVRKADRAMYAVKKSGRNNFNIYDDKRSSL